MPMLSAMASNIPGRTHTGVTRGEERRVQIVESATRLFAAQGIRATTLTEIAADAGMKRPALLHHFESKEALIHVVMDGHARNFLPTQRSIARYRGLEAISHLVEIAEYDEANPARVALWNALVADTTSAESTLRGRVLEYYALFRFAVGVMLDQAAEDGELRDGVDRKMVANTIIAFLNGIETSWVLDPDLPLVPTVRQFLNDMVSSLRKP